MGIITIEQVREFAQANPDPRIETFWFFFARITPRKIDAMKTNLSHQLLKELHVFS